MQKRNEYEDKVLALNGMDKTVLDNIRFRHIGETKLKRLKIK